MTLELTILMPCLNEAETIKTCIQKAHVGARNAGVENYEILIADNGSTDDSQRLAEDNGARVIHVQEKGYGAALRGGIRESLGKFIIMGDADDSYDWKNVKPFVERLRAGNDLVMGSRLHGTILPGAMPPLHRWLGNPVLTWTGNVLFRTHVSDFHCGMRGFSRDAITSLNLQTSGMEFATEMVAKAGLFGLSISEFPITYYPDGRSRRPHLRTWRDGWRHLTFMLAVSPNWVFLYPGLIMLMFGLIGGLSTLVGPIKLGGIVFDVHTLLMASLLLITSAQLLAFWVIARFYSIQIGLLPRHTLLDNLTSGSAINTAILLGVLIVTAGTIPLLVSIEQWIQTDFGPLDYQVTLRLIIPALTAIVIGLQVFFLSFVIGMMNLGGGNKQENQGDYSPGLNQ